MIMNDQRFKELAAKCLDNTASIEEEREFMKAYMLLQNRHNSWDEQLMGNEEVFKKDMYREVVSKIDHHTGYRRLMPLIKIAASILLFISIGFTAWHFKSNILNYVDPINQMTASTVGDIKIIQLADGTKVWLNSASKLAYPDKFRDGSSREISLVGEAYFEVVHIKDQPFIIHTGKVNTTVLGTTFDIKAYEQEQNIEITVATGKVGVTQESSSSHGNKAVFVTPNQRVVYNKVTNALSKDNNVIANKTISWTDGKFNFNGEALANVVLILQRRYTVKILYDKSLSKCPVFADFTNEPIDKIVKILALSFRGKATKEPGGFYIHGKVCK
jgi:transmembrane sensor